jgi:predicted RNase H-like nuclease (RuvC/YqgF family)
LKSEQKQLKATYDETLRKQTQQLNYLLDTKQKYESEFNNMYKMWTSHLNKSENFSRKISSQQKYITEKDLQLSQTQKKIDEINQELSFFKDTTIKNEGYNNENSDTDDFYADWLKKI